MKMNIVAVIPARYASTRFPGKPLADVCGKTMIERVYEQASGIAGICRVIVATDDERIDKTVRAFGGETVMTSSECASGTDRVAEAVKNIDADAVINVQGDQVVLDSKALAGLVECMSQNEQMGTIAVPAKPDDYNDPNIVKVVCSISGYALYFSRSRIPYERSAGNSRMLKHVGIYGYTKETLFRFRELPQSPLELTESLEQLRALENGIPIKVVVAEGEFHEINTPEDRERIIRKWPHLCS
jgi:3-deoxy-manno-octulosonate cytidylyltransferase (CMP-KDO synthetase)